MFTSGFIVIFVAASAFARPQIDAQVSQVSPGSATTPVAIVNQTENVGPDGSVNFSYQTSNGIYVQELVSRKRNEQYNPQDPESSTDVQVIQGTYQYTAPDGQVINLRFIADENGFQPQGEHLPTAPPVPKAIADSIASIVPQQQQQQQTIGGSSFASQSGSSFASQSGTSLGSSSFAGSSATGSSLGRSQQFQSSQSASGPLVQTVGGNQPFQPQPFQGGQQFSQQK